MTNDDESTLRLIAELYEKPRLRIHIPNERFYRLEYQYLLGEIEGKPEQHEANMDNINKFIAKLTRLIENETQYGHHELAGSYRQLLDTVLSNQEIKQWKSTRKQRRIDRADAKWEKYKRKHGIIECP